MGVTCLPVGKDWSGRIWEISSGRLVAMLPHDEEVISVAFSRDAKLCATGCWDGIARVWDVVSGKQISSCGERGNYQVTSVLFSADGRRCIFSAGNGPPKAWDLETGQPVDSGTNHPLSITCQAMSADGTLLVSGGVLLDRFPVMCWSP